MKGRKEQIVFYSQEVTANASGFRDPDAAPVEYWVTKAEVSTLRDGGEPNARKTEGYRETLREGYIFKMRFRKDKALTTAMTIGYKGKTLTIHGVENIDAADKWLKVVGLGDG